MFTVSSGRAWPHAPSQIHRTSQSPQKPSLLYHLPEPPLPTPSDICSSRGQSSAYPLPPDQPRYLSYLYSTDSRSGMSDYHVRSPSRDRGQTRNLPSRSPSRDMSWRKPVPKFIPSPPLSPNQLRLPHYTESSTATTFGFTVDRANPFSMSLTSLNSDVPPVCGGATPTPRFCSSLVRGSC